MSRLGTSTGHRSLVTGHAVCLLVELVVVFAPPELALGAPEVRQRGDLRVEVDALIGGVVEARPIDGAVAVGIAAGREAGPVPLHRLAELAVDLLRRHYRAEDVRDLRTMRRAEHERREKIERD